MFNLETAITDWHQQMLAAGIQSPVPLEELESHLREEIARKMGEGCDAAAAFKTAVEKFGQPIALEHEFKRSAEGNDSRRWKRRALLSVLALGMVPMTALTLMRTDMNLAWRLAGVANIAVFALALLGHRQVNQWFPVIPNARVRRSIGIGFALAGFAAMIIFMTLILPKFSLTLGQIQVVVLWGLTLMAACGAISAGLEEAARRHDGWPIKN